MFLFDNIPPKQFALLATLLGLILVDVLNDNEQNSLGNFLVSIGQTLMTNASQVQTQKAIADNQQRYDELCNQLSLLSAQLDDLKKQRR
jgi:hypothetical protein